MKVYVSIDKGPSETPFLEPVGEFSSPEWASKFVRSVLNDSEEHGTCTRIIVDLAEEDT